MLVIKSLHDNSHVPIVEPIIVQYIYIPRYTNPHKILPTKLSTIGRAFLCTILTVLSIQLPWTVNITVLNEGVIVVEVGGVRGVCQRGYPTSFIGQTRLHERSDTAQLDITADSASVNDRFLDKQSCCAFIRLCQHSVHMREYFIFLIFVR